MSGARGAVVVELCQGFHFISKVRELKWNEMYGLQVQMKWNEMKCFSFFNSTCEMKINEIILY
jgi:hypothetical protein